MEKYKIARQVITHYESFSATCFLKSSGVTAIGYGRTCGNMIRTSEKEEDMWLTSKLFSLNLLIDNEVKGYITQAQIAALMSFIYDLGEGTFRMSPLLKMLNSKDRDMQKIADEILCWSKTGQYVVPAMAKRRMTEYLLFTTGQMNLF